MAGPLLPGGGNQAGSHAGGCRDADLSRTPLAGGLPRAPRAAPAALRALPERGCAPQLCQDPDCRQRRGERRHGRRGRGVRNGVDRGDDPARRRLPFARHPGTAGRQAEAPRSAYPPRRPRARARRGRRLRIGFERRRERQGQVLGRGPPAGERPGQAEAREQGPSLQASAGGQLECAGRASRQSEVGVERQERCRARIREERQEGLSLVIAGRVALLRIAFSLQKGKRRRTRESAMAVRDEVLEANRSYAESFDKCDLPGPPGRPPAVVTCMDARLDPAKFLGLDEGDAHVIRNPGGVVSDDALRSLVISHWLLGTQEALVIAPTGCGMLPFPNDDIHAKLADEAGADASGIDFLPFPDLDDSVRESVERVRTSDLLPKSFTATGYVYDCATGALREVD